MSRQLALDTINLRPTPRLAHTEYSLEYHHDYIRQATGCEPGTPEATRRLGELWQIDFAFRTSDGLHGDWSKFGRATDMGHAIYAADGHDQRPPRPSPFKTVDDVLAFDAVEEYGLPDFEAQVAAFERQASDAREIYPEQLATGGCYKTIVSGAIAAFGWDMLLLAAADQDGMERVLDSFFRRTLFNVKAWARTSAEVFIQHDDFVWSEGPFVHPDFYRRVIIPRYAELWKPLHAAGKKVLFCSDGLYTMFMPDLAAAGADGFIFEPCNDFGAVVADFGASKCLIGSYVDCRDLAFRPWETVRTSMDRTLALAHRCKGLIWACGNHLPPNIPASMMRRYIDYFKANYRR